MVISSHEVILRPLETPPVTVSDLFGEELGWKAGVQYWTRNASHSFRDVDNPMCTIVSGNILLVLSMLVISQVSTT